VDGLYSKEVYGQKGGLFCNDDDGIFPDIPYQVCTEAFGTISWAVGTVP
jgi:hypothetical protein